MTKPEKPEGPRKDGKKRRYVAPTLVIAGSLLAMSQKGLMATSIPG